MRATQWRDSMEELIDNARFNVSLQHGSIDFELVKILLLLRGGTSQRTIIYETQFETAVTSGNW